MPLTRLTLPHPADTYLETLQATSRLAANSAHVEAARLRTYTQVHPDAATQPTPQHIDTWLRNIAHDKPTTRRSTTGAVRRYLQWLHATRNTPDLTHLIPKVREPKRAPRALSRPDADHLLAAPDHPRTRCELALMVACGLRCVEVARLQIADIDVASGTLICRGKGGDERPVPLPAVAAKAVTAWLDVRGWHAGPLIVSLRTNRLKPVTARTISRHVARRMAALGLHEPGDRRTAHALRHTAAADLLDHSGDLRSVQALLGHRSLATTEIYLPRAETGPMREALDRRWAA